MQGYSGSLIESQVDGPPLSNTTTATSLLPLGAKWTMGAGQLDRIGRIYRVHASFRISTAASSPGNITFDLRIGSVIVATSQAMALATSQTNVTLRLQWDLTLRAITTASTAATANFMHTAEAKSAALSGGPLILIPASAPAVGTSFDSTAAAQVDLFGTWSTASASNTITNHMYYLESLN